MLLSQEIYYVITNANTLYERINSSDFKYNSIVDTEKKVERWHKVLKTFLPMRLELEGWFLDNLISVLGKIIDISLPPMVLPEWAEMLASIWEIKATESQGERCLEPEDLVAFQEVFIPIIQWGRKQLQYKLGDSYNLLSSESHKALERSLLKKLSYICGQTLVLEFSVFRNSKISKLECEKELSGKEVYQQFIQDLLESKLQSILVKYIFLARLIVVTLHLWIESSQELITRLSTDWSFIEKNFSGEKRLSTVTRVETNLADPHSGGRTVMILHFDSGLKLVYKPRDCGIEEAYYSLLTWFNDNYSPFDFKILRVLSKHNYGWVEYVENLGCDKATQIEKYYQRCGALLCVMYVLQATDCHFENIIAHQDYPVLVDAETLVYPCIEGVKHSLDSIGLLPDLESSFDNSGLGYDGKGMYPIKAPQWYNINTDFITFSLEYIESTVAKNIPCLNNNPCSFHNYRERILEGFSRMYHYIMGQKKVLIKKEHPIYKLSNQPVRFIFRNTKAYISLIHHLLNPKFLKDGIDFSIEVDVLFCTLFRNPSLMNFWPLVKQEQLALQQLDVPYFTVSTSSRNLPLSPTTNIPDYFESSAYESVITRWQELDEADLLSQIQTIRRLLKL